MSSLKHSFTMIYKTMQPNRLSSIHDIRYQKTIDILIQARKEKGISQSVLAKKLGFAQPDISKIERLERRLDIIEFLDLLEAIADEDISFFDQKWIEINECHRRFSSSNKDSK